MSFAHSSIGSLILFLLVSRRLLITNAKPIVSTPLAFLKKDFLFFLIYLFGFEVCGILVPQTRIKPAPLALKCRILTTGLPPESHLWLFGQLLRLLASSSSTCIGLL